MTTAAKWLAGTGLGLALVGTLLVAEGTRRLLDGLEFWGGPSPKVKRGARWVTISGLLMVAAGFAFQLAAVLSA